MISTFDINVYAKIRHCLAEAGIRCRVKTSFTGHSGGSGMAAGRFGERADLTTQYQIFVKKEDFEKAQYYLRC